MKIITINLPEKYLDAIQTLQDLGIVPSRSQALRNALHDFLGKELKFSNDLGSDSFRMLQRGRSL